MEEMGGDWKLDERGLPTLANADRTGGMKIKEDRSCKVEGNLTFAFHLTLFKTSTPPQKRNTSNRMVVGV